MESSRLKSLHSSIICRLLSVLLGHVTNEQYLGKEDPGHQTAPLPSECTTDGSPFVGLPPHQDHGNGSHS